MQNDQEKERQKSFVVIKEFNERDHPREITTFQPRQQVESNK